MSPNPHRARSLFQSHPLGRRRRRCGRLISCPRGTCSRLTRRARSSQGRGAPKQSVFLVTAEGHKILAFRVGTLEIVVSATPNVRTKSGFGFRAKFESVLYEAAIYSRRAWRYASCSPMFGYARVRRPWRGPPDTKSKEKPRSIAPANSLHSQNLDNAQRGARMKTVALLTLPHWTPERIGFWP